MTLRSRLARAAALLTGAAALAAGSAVVSGPTAAAASLPERALLDLPGTPVHEEYVALGDSFSAGPLIPQQRLDPLGCLRSTTNYPAYLAGYFDVGSYVDVTCSAAETTDMTAPQSTVVPGTHIPQFDALRPTTDLVTLGIGGNDYGLFGEMISECERVREQDPKGAPCRDYFTVDGVDTKLRDARRIYHRVVEVVAGIRARSPEADVVVVGYLRILPEVGTCDDVPFADGDYVWGNQVQETLNDSLRRAAQKHGATYVDMYPVSEHHDACAGPDAWVNGSEIEPLRAANFHPFAKGMRNIAQETYRQMTGQPAPLEVLPRPYDGATAALTPDELLELGQQLEAGLTG
jgi:lysophospholipase L1-like esterase